MRIETVREQAAYDAGWAEGKDYWVPLEQDRIIMILEELKNFKLDTPQRIEHRLALEVMIEKLKNVLRKGGN